MTVSDEIKGLIRSAAADPRANYSAQQLAEEFGIDVREVRTILESQYVPALKRVDELREPFKQAWLDPDVKFTEICKKFDLKMADVYELQRAYNLPSRHSVRLARLAEVQQQFYAMYADGDQSVNRICRTLGISRNRAYEWLDDPECPVERRKPNQLLNQPRKALSDEL